MKLTSATIHNIAQRANLEFFNDGMLAVFDTQLLCGDALQFNMKHDTWAYNQDIARYKLEEWLKAVK